MAFFKEIWVSSQGGRGFNEVYYKSADDLDTAATYPLALINAALGMRSNLTILQKIRVSSVVGNRVTAVVNINRPVTGGAGLDGPDVASTAAVYNLNSFSKGFTRRVWFRGLPDCQVRRDPSTGQDIPGATLATAAKNFIIKLASNGYQVRALFKLTGVAPLVNVPITSVVVPVNPGTISLTNAGFNTLDQQPYVVSLIDPKLFPGVNGIRRAYGNGNNELILRYRSALAPGTFTQLRAHMRVASYDYGPITPGDNDFSKFGSRDTGKNSSGGRGRKTATKLFSA